MRYSEERSTRRFVFVSDSRKLAARYTMPWRNLAPSTSDTAPTAYPDEVRFKHQLTMCPTPGSQT